MNNKEKKEEVWEHPLTNKNRTLIHLNISHTFLSNYKRLKNDMNCTVFNAMELERPKDEIKTLIVAVDIIDGISDQLRGVMEGAL